jgi:hypothetical protein
MEISGLLHDILFMKIVLSEKMPFLFSVTNARCPFLHTSVRQLRSFLCTSPPLGSNTFPVFVRIVFFLYWYQCTREIAHAVLYLVTSTSKQHLLLQLQQTCDSKLSSVYTPVGYDKPSGALWGLPSASQGQDRSANDHLATARTRQGYTPSGPL